MTFTPINRGKMPTAAGFSATPADSVRLSTYRPRPGGKPLLVIWLGCDVASQLGLIARREQVSVMTDNAAPLGRVAIKADPQGEFYAAKKLRGYSVHLDAPATAFLVGDDHFAHDIIGPELLQFDAQMVSFPMPELRERGQRP